MDSTTNTEGNPTPANQVVLPPEYWYQGYTRSQIVTLKRTAVISLMGSGKTRPIIDALVELGVIDVSGNDILPQGAILVLASGPAIATWMRQLPEWTNRPQLADSIIPLVGGGNADKRRQVWRDVREDPRIVITNASIFRIDFTLIQNVKWVAVIADEYHKYMIRRKSQTFKRFKALTREIPIIVLTSGSALRKNPASLWTAFNLARPRDRQFTSYWRYVNTYCHVTSGHFGSVIEGPKNIQGFKDTTDKYLVYIPEDVVADELPEGKRQRVYILMTPEQERIYRQMEADMFAFLEDGDMLVASNILGQWITQRKLLCCPRMLDASLGMGAGFELIRDNLEYDKHCAIFVPFRDACDHIHAELKRLGYESAIVRGGISPQELQDTLDYLKSVRGILISTIAYAESFDFETCRTSWFLGYGYLLDQNRQAEGRTRRVISTHEFVTWNYICYSNTLDEDMLHGLNEDMRNVNKMISRPVEYMRQRYLQHQEPKQ